MLLTIFSTFFIAKSKEEQDLNHNCTQEIWEKNMKLIAKSYLKGYFIFDILACVPSLFTSNMDKSAFMFKYFKFLYVPRILFKILRLKEVIIRRNSENLICIVNTYHVAALIC